MIHGVILTGLFLLGGLWLGGSLFVQRRIITWLSSGMVVGWGVFLAATIVARVLGLSGDPKLMSLYGGAVVLGLCAWYLRSYFSLPIRQGRGVRDLIVLAVLIPVLVSVAIISGANGQQTDGSWKFHGFYNGDTTTFVSLVQKSFFTPYLVTDNPFADGTPLEYPTLLHGGIADLFALFGVTVDWVHFLPIMTLLGVLVTIPLFFLLFDEVILEPSNPAEMWFGLSSRTWVYMLQGVIVLYVLTYAWDNYVYPQSHFFLTSLFILIVVLLVSLGKASGARFAISLGLALITGIVLLLANAVMGAIGIALLALYGLHEAASNRVGATTRGWYLLLTFGMIGCFFLFSSGDAQFGLPHFSYGAAADMVRFAPVMALVLVAILWRQEDSFLKTATLAVAALGFFTFFFSARDIIVDNASRFLYHALLIGFPLLLPIVIRIGFLLRQELFFTTRDGMSRVMPWLATALALLLLSLPPLASVASAFDHLLRNDEQIVSNVGREAVWRINDYTSPEAVILTSPEAPWIVPFFTGRSLLRAGSASDGAYWLSTDDDIFRLQILAFEGNRAAQTAILPRADFLVLTASERSAWEPLPYEKVLDITDLVIYKLR